MSKQVSADYTSAMKYVFLNKSTYVNRRTAAIFGVSENNIGESISKKLNLNHRVDTITEEEMDLRDVTKISLFPFSKYDTFIFNNGFTNLDWIENQTPYNISQAITINLTSNIIATREIVRQTMGDRQIKIIIFIGSMAHSHVLNGSAPYCAAKAGLQHFARCISYELAPKGYRVYCVNPSNVQDSPMSEKTIKGLMEYRGLTRVEAEAYWAAECPMGTFLRKDEIADVVEFLLTEKARYMSPCIDLPGGQR